jgi:hypothetical protein
MAPETEWNPNPDCIYRISHYLTAETLSTKGTRTRTDTERGKIFRIFTTYNVYYVNLVLSRCFIMGVLSRLRRSSINEKAPKRLA